jgi:serine/threonine protein kinase
MTDIKKYEPLWGSWRVDSLIGEGSYGKVYKVKKEEFGVAYYSAVKIISIPQSDAELRQAWSEGMDSASAKSYFHTFVADIVQEVELMSAFRGNSNIVSFEDHKVVEREDEVGWDILIRMELLSSLSEKVTEKLLSVDEVVKLGIHICRALELCALKRTIHRDIKPDNIFVSQYGDYKLGDFGIARRIERTMSGLSKKGTYTYMAPEVFNGRDYGASVDLYSLGIVMYRFLNKNRTPFLPAFPAAPTHLERDAALARRMKGDPIPPIEGISDELNAIVLKACAFDRAERYGDAAEMRAALESYAKISVREPVAVPEPEAAPAKEESREPEPEENTLSAFREETRFVYSPRANEKTVAGERPSGAVTVAPPADAITNGLAALAGASFAILSLICLTDRAERQTLIFLPFFLFCLAECAVKFRYKILNGVFLASLFLFLSSVFLTFRYFDYHALILTWTMAALAASRSEKPAARIMICLALVGLSIAVSLRALSAVNGVARSASYDFLAGAAAIPLITIVIAAAGSLLIFRKDGDAADRAVACLFAVQFFALAVLALGLAGRFFPAAGSADTAFHIANADFLGVTPEFFSWWRAGRIFAPSLELLAYVPFAALMFARFSPGAFTRFFDRENRARNIFATAVFFCLIAIAAEITARSADAFISRLLK